MRSADEVLPLLRRFNAGHGSTALFMTPDVVDAQSGDTPIEITDGRVSP